MFGHWFEILGVVFVGLLVFGPKRMIEMGSQLGKMVRDLRESTRDINFSALLSTDDAPKQPTYTYTAPSATATPPFGANTPGEETIVDAGIEHTEDIAN